MIVKQKQNLEAFVRVLAFLEEHPVEGPLGYTGPRETLDEAVRRLREYAGAQVTGRQLSRGELRRQKQLIKQLFDRHMRPIVTVARAQIEPDSDVRLPAAIRMPRADLGATKLLQACDGMIEAARPFEAVFVANGLPADFLARFTAARDELERGLTGRATYIGKHIGARTGLQVQMRRARRAVDRLDAVVRASFDGDDVTLATWRSAKRAHQRPGGSTARGTDTAEVQLPLAA
jgi:hypothetical protein